MKKKYILISLSPILLIALFATVIINQNSKEYIMQDGIMLALTLDGEKINSFPEERNYYIEVNCENGKGKWLVEEWKLSVEEVTGNVVCNIDFTSNPKTLTSKVEEVNVDNNYNNHGYRYSGTNPDNYVWFNNEMWRIIGSIPTCLSASCGTNTTNLVKIIRNESIGGVVFNHSTSTPAWGRNKLYTLLNSYYYGKQNGTGTDYCYGYQATSQSKCDYSVKGINPDGYYGEMIKNVYWNTGGIDYTYKTNTAYTYEIKTRTISGYIGLMSASDLGYGADSSYHTSELQSYSGSTLTNWLYQGYEWTITPYYEDSNYIMYFTSSGVQKMHAARSSMVVRPVVYLDQSVYIISGDGTEGNPYQIGM